MKQLIVGLVTSLLLGPPAAAWANTLTVKTVHDGGTVEFEGGFTVHLKGISVPGPKTQIGWLAYDFTKRRLEGKVVAVFTWTTDNTAAGIVHGRDGLPFATIRYGKGFATDIAADLLARGLARIDLELAPGGCEHYPEIERRAKEKGSGSGHRAIELSPSACHRGA
jgi:hypothetical protein